MKVSELRRWLRDRGCTFEEGTRHTIVIYRGKAATIPRHPSQEIAKGTLFSILNRLGLKPD